MHLIVGLGNPGAEYEHTPHNVGFSLIDRLAHKHGIRVNRPEGNALVGVGKIAGAEAVLAKPLSYMNLSGGPVKTLLGKYEMTGADLLVAYDELDLPWGGMRMRPKGSAAGHKGVASIISSLGSDEFARLRLGIHPGRPIGSGAKYVLRLFSKTELEELDQILERAAEVVELYMAEGVDKAMAVANRRA